MVEDRVWQGPLKPTWGPYIKSHLLVPKNNRKYHNIIAAVRANWHILYKDGIPPIITEYSIAYVRLRFALLMEFHTGYDHTVLKGDRQDHMSLQSTLGIYRLTRPVQ